VLSNLHHIASAKELVSITRGNKFEFAGFPWCFPDIYPVIVAGDDDDENVFFLNVPRLDAYGSVIRRVAVAHITNFSFSRRVRPISVLSSQMSHKPFTISVNV
jgi:hypothetical protein